MFARIVQRLAAGRRSTKTLRRSLMVATKPAATPLLVGTLADLARRKPAPVLENARLRQQLVILRRSVKRPHCTSTDRALLVSLASRLRTWRQALLIVQLFTRFWRWESRAAAPAHRPPLAPETVTLIREMAAANRTWGAERIRGELLKPHIHVAKSTIQWHMRAARPPWRSGQTWATFLANHGKDIWTTGEHRATQSQGTAAAA
jgi:hypothetical protein